ncbi:MAG: hypothetical protein NTW14_13425 [bacterium]|nr:hypothetical protein [bacterium]
MRWIVIALVCLTAISSAQADMLYLQNGQVYSGKVTEQDNLTFKIELSDGTQLNFLKSETFQVTDNAGAVLWDGSQSQTTTPQIPPPILNPTEDAGQTQSGAVPQVEYRRVVHFPYWPLLGGAAILGYLGIDQLSKSSDTYKESEERENQGLEFNSMRTRSQKQKTWGQIGIAAAVACLVIGATPQFEKVPIQQSIHVIPTGNGFMLTINF